MKNELISIIVPIYNVQQYLEKCVNSLIKQSYKNIEIILVDDGSTDKSGEIAMDLKKMIVELEYFIKIMVDYQMQGILG